MSDDPGAVQDAAPVPTTHIIPADDAEGGGYAVVMHMGQEVRAFLADTMDRARKVMVDLGMNVFGLDQDTAEQTADAAVQKHADAAAAAVETPDPAAVADTTDADAASMPDASVPVPEAGGSVATSDVGFDAGAPPSSTGPMQDDDPPEDDDAAAVAEGKDSSG